MKKSIKTDKMNYIAALALEAEEAVRPGNLKDLYSTTKKAVRKDQPTSKTDKGQRRKADNR